MPTLTPSHYRGSLLGLAIGDALGTAVEFSPPGTFPPVQDMTGGGPFRLAPGQWTDDTSMALCLAESLLEKSGFDAIDQLERYTRWWHDGHLSSNGKCFDIGNTVRAALHTFERTRSPRSGPTTPDTAGNGSIMRLAPIPMFFAATPREAIHQAAESSRATHGARACIDACRYLAGLIVGALRGRSKTEILSAHYSPVLGAFPRQPLCDEIDEIAAGSFKRRSPPEIVGSGYVVRSLEAALWALHATDTFDEGCLLAVNLGHDADTTAAIYGQLAGALYGEDAIKPEWRAKLAHRDLIAGFADKLFLAAQARHPEGPIADSYWVSPGSLLAGEYPAAWDDAAARRKLRFMLADGVTFFLDLTEPGEHGLVAYEPMLREEAAALGISVEHQRIAIRDMDVPTVATMRTILDVIDRETAAGKTVYVHCFGGIGRTGTVVGCHLVERGRDGDAALQRIAALRRGTPDGRRESPERDAQLAMVRAWSRP